MMKKLLNALLSVTLLAAAASAQVPIATHIQILKAEDARRYDETLAALMKHKDAGIRTRAALAAGRIGNEAAIPALISMLKGDPSPETREMAAFALGEIESIKAADAILQAIGETGKPLMPGKIETNNRGRLAEAAGKIAAANPKDPKAKDLGDAILFTLEAEYLKGTAQDKETVLLALTAALRARPEKTDVTVAKFLSNPNARVRADAANTLSRVRAKNANETLRAMLAKDSDPIARANAARALGAAEDKDAVELLIKAATQDKDSRVRVSAIRSLSALKDAKAAEPLLTRGEFLFAAYKKAKKPNLIPNEHSEFLEVAAALGRLLQNTRNTRAVDLFREFGKLDKGHSPEVYIARVRISPGRGGDEKSELTHWRQYSTLAQVVGEFSAIEPADDEARQMKIEAPLVLGPLAKAFAEADPVSDASTIKAGPDVLAAFARFKTADLAGLLRTALQNKDVQIRVAAANLLADLPPEEENANALTTAFGRSLVTDKDTNDAQLAILEALVKLDKNESIGPMREALQHPDHLVRKKALDLLKDKDSWKTVPAAMIDELNRSAIGSDTVRPYDPKSGTKLGQVLNTDADYRRALTRKNGTIKAVLTTDKGTFTIDLLPEDAPLTVDNFVKLARSNYFNGLEVHRVVPNFVMQDGDPRGDGNGGPGWSIRCEINMVPYDRGAVGMALSGKDTGGSQWFVTHSPQPHLDGGYTVFGRVNETGMKVVDQIVREDKVIRVRIVGR